MGASSWARATSLKIFVRADSAGRAAAAPPRAKPGAVEVAHVGHRFERAGAVQEFFTVRRSTLPLMAASFVSGSMSCG